MSLRNQKNKDLFINILQGNKRENHRVLISERIFKLNDLKRWKLYLKLILQRINYLCEINEEDIDILLRDVIKEVNNNSRAFKRKMGYELGDWRDY